MRKTLFCLMIFVLFFQISGESVKLMDVVEIKTGKKHGKLTDLILGKKKENYTNPSSLFMIGGDLIGIVDQVNARVIILNKTRKVQKIISGFGKKRFQSPVSGTCGSENKFYISDSILRMIIRFNDSMSFDRVIFSDSNLRLTGICFYNGKLFCTDTGNHRVVILDERGKQLKAFGVRGTGEGEFNFPTHVFVDSEQIYITDALNSRIQIFDHNGIFVRTFGKNGMRGGDFSKPKGIAVDSKKRIFVTDVMFDNVQIFDAEGRFLSYFGESGSEDNNFWMPGGIMIDEKDLIYVADTYNHRIKIFKVISEKE